MPNVLKKYGLWIVLVITLAATIWTSQQDDMQEPSMHLDTNISAPVSAAKNSNGLKSKIVISDANTTTAQREEILEIPSNLFSALTATDNINAASIAEPAFVNPFIYAGKLVDEGRVTVFLLEGDKSHAVKVGNIIEELWKVKSIVPPIMVLKNLSTKIEVQIEIGALS